MTALFVGAPSPFGPLPEGFRLIWDGGPILVVSMANPTRDEARAVRFGAIIHKLGTVPDTAWISLMFGKELSGEVFFNAGAQPADFSDETLAELRDQLLNSDGGGKMGLSCILLLIDADSQKIAAMRNYSWGHDLSGAFLAHAEATRGGSKAAGDKAAEQLMRLPSTALAAKATVATFTLRAKV